ncbi:MAG TPA: amidase [Cerasibacillus sp.]|uniref:amidase n=1 Tax=Cerasibacillus sp. TaxID=2498711 RepID=UPI002F3F77E0
MIKGGKQIVVSDKEILSMDATTLGNKIANQEITSVYATKTYIAHLKKVNSKINCLVEDRFDEALKEAENADKEIKQNGVGHKKLFGVPISMKESFDVVGMKTTGGLLHLKDAIGKKDAEVVARLKAEGAIILGKTNTPALCFCQETDNKLYGRTNNPWDLTKTSGGSSGGEAALLAIGGAAAGIGSDIGGSIRFPSHFNGVIGFKSGNRQVSQDGSFPQADIPLEERMLGIGPMTKSVQDANMMYNIIAKQPAPRRDLTNFTMTILPRMNYPMSDETEAMLTMVQKQMEDEFNTLREVPPFFDQSALLWQEMMSIDGGQGMAEITFANNKRKEFREYIKEIFTGKSDVHRYLSWALIGAYLFKPSEKRVLEINSLIAQGDKKLDDYLDERILIFPVYHTGALKHGRVYKEIFSIRKTFLKYMPYVAYANVWGLPSLTIPIQTDKQNLPISVQLMSKNGNEDALFQLGEWLESRNRGYVRCPKYD